MAAPATIPVEVTPEAAARIEELWRSKEFEAMIEHTKQTVAGLESILVTRFDDPDDPAESRVSIEARQQGPESEDISAWDESDSWFVDSFPPEVRRYFGFTMRFRENHEG
jgi:hypothetical protein